LKYILPITIFLVLLAYSKDAFAQTGKLHVYINDGYIESDCLELTLKREQDTFYLQTITNSDIFEESEIEIDSLDPGMYLLSLVNCGSVSDEQFHSATTYVEIKSGKIAHRNFYMDLTVRYTDVDQETDQEIIEARTEFQMEYSYFDFRWNPEGNDPKFNFGMAGSGYSWICFSKHVGFLIGGGFGWNFAQLQIDEQSEAIYPDEIKSNYYNYFYLDYDIKFRFSLFNQQSPDLSGTNVFLDLGAQYNFPLYFKRVTRFNIQDKLVNGFIHRYSDLRLYANFGITNFQVFASYRPFDFINKDLPQFPKYNVGVKFNVHD